MNGYNTLDICALCPNFEMPISLYSKVYSTTEKGFLSENQETINALDEIKKHIGTKGIYTLDRGYDNNLFYKYFIENEMKFVIRAKKNRNVIFENKSINILRLAKSIKTTHECLYVNRDGKSKKLRIGHAEIQLPCSTEKLKLVVVKGLTKHEPMILLTNLEMNKRTVDIVAEVYIQRWKIEEYFRFKKQQFDFENIRVRSLNSIRSMNLILTILIGFIALFSDLGKEYKIYETITKLSNRIFEIPELDYYAIADGIKNLLRNAIIGIQSCYKVKMVKKDISGQISFFELYEEQFVWAT